MSLPDGVLASLFVPFGTATVYVAQCCGNLYVGEVRPGACKKCGRAITVDTVDLSDPAAKQVALDNL
jgi:hypothetical protein